MVLFFNIVRLVAKVVIIINEPFHPQSQTQVQMSMEISPMHHSVVIGRNAEQLKVIMRGTGTQIMFPDAEDPNISSLRKSCVTITGQIKDVYTARQQLMVTEHSRNFW